MYAVVHALRRLMRGNRRLVTTNLVIAESHALLMRRVNRRAALAFLEAVVKLPHVIVFSTPEREARAQLDWLALYDDHDFSFTNAISFAVMNELRLTLRAPRRLDCSPFREHRLRLRARVVARSDLGGGRRGLRALHGHGRGHERAGRTLQRGRCIPRASAPKPEAPRFGDRRRCKRVEASAHRAR